MFVVLLKYVKPIDIVDQHLLAHRAFLDTLYKSGDLLCSGPQNPRTGGVLLARTPHRDTLEKLIKDDPFYQAGVADYQIIEFEPVKFANDFANCLHIT